MVLGLILGIISGVIMMVLGGFLARAVFSPKERPLIFREDYKEFSSSDYLAKIWQEPKKNHTPCKRCGMDDQPLMKVFNIWGYELICKWCAELAEIKGHLLLVEAGKPVHKRGPLGKFLKSLENIFMAFGDLVRVFIP